MNQYKFLVIVIVLVILSVGGMGLSYYLENKKYIEKNEQRKIARQEEMRKNNPALLDSLNKSIEDSKKIISEDPNKQTAWTTLGVSYQNLGDYIEAKKAYLEAIKISEITQVAWNNLVDIYIEEENYKEAEKALLKQIDANKESSAYMKLAEMYIENHEGNIHDAIAILQRGIEETKQPSLQDALSRVQLTGKL